MVCSYTVRRTQYDRLSQQQLGFLLNTADRHRGVCVSLSLKLGYFVGAVFSDLNATGADRRSVFVSSTHAGHSDARKRAETRAATPRGTDWYSRTVKRLSVAGYKERRSNVVYDDRFDQLRGR